MIIVQQAQTDRRERSQWQSY
uniref:Uncharacterized protein n=1 Tax=Musa acuminata subsp. malaccensis TaxID=214687 RepID=A0A804JXV3_MUSAM